MNPEDIKYLDKNGVEVKEFNVLKIYHYTARLRRQKCYMYKWVRNVNGYLVGMHLNNADKDSWFSLRSLINPDTGRMDGVEIVQ